MKSPDRRTKMQSRTAAHVLTGLALFALFAGVALPAQAQTVSTLYNFGGVTGDPNGPSGPMAQGRDGNIYGVSQAGPIGGPTNNGVVYKVSRSGVVTPLHTVQTSEGIQCTGLSLATDGNFYGTCYADPVNNAGTIFKVTSAGTLTVMHTFAGGTSDGCRPLAPPIQGTDGNLYGTTSFCGANNYGTVYKMTLAGAYTQLYNFQGPPNDTALPLGLVQGNDGNLWGMGNGWIISPGGVFKITPAGKETLVYTFKGGTDGQNPYTSLIQGSDGKYYGTTEGNGGSDTGTVFKLTAAGVETVLYDFPSPPTMGGFPRLPLTQGPDGVLYGIATNCAGGGCSQAGLFDITTKNVYSTLYLYPILGGSNNELPLSPLLLSTNGRLYSATQQGGSHQNGSFYSVSTNYSPFISLVNITSAKPEGAKIGILGQGFTSASVVKFGGTVATTIQRTGGTFILATVPAGALTGPVTVTTGATTLATNQPFKVKPTLTTFTPPSGPVGTPVTITGTGLTQATKVTFNGTSATFTVNSDTQITATVPTGATSGTITVTATGGGATSSTSFTVN
jgi:uncharacterized repeat protein (TIGR03803 family)